MAYRSNQRENELRKQHEEAKAALEELADQKHLDLPSMEDTLQTMGFLKEAEVDHGIIGPIMIYRRETAEGLEVLVECDLMKIDDKTPHLYHLPAGQDVGEWYNANKVTELNKWREKKDNKIGTMGLYAMMISVGLGAAVDYLLISPSGNGIFLWGWISPLVIGYAALLYMTHKKHPLQKQVVAKGPDALRYIARNSTYNPAYNPADNVPRLRIANPDNEEIPVRITVRAEEFTDEQAELEVLATAEQMQEELGQTKRK